MPRSRAAVFTVVIVIRNYSLDHIMRFLQPRARSEFREGKKTTTGRSGTDAQSVKKALM